MKHPDTTTEPQEQEIQNLRERVAELEAAQAQAKKSAAAHAASEARLAGILSISEDAIISVDSELRIRMDPRSRERQRRVRGASDRSCRSSTFPGPASAITPRPVAWTALDISAVLAAPGSERAGPCYRLNAASRRLRRWALTDVTPF